MPTISYVRRQPGPLPSWHELAYGEPEVVVLDFANDHCLIRSVDDPSLNFDDTIQEAIDATILSFTRASDAGRFNADGDYEAVGSGVWRRQYDPLGLALPGYLSEPSRTNLALRSNEFDNASWGKANCTITANASVGRDGTSSMDKIVEAATTSSHGVQQSISFTSGTSYTVSFDYKAAERTWAFLLLPFAAFGVVLGYADLTNGVLGTTSGGTWSIQHLGGGIYRVSVTATATATSSGNVFTSIASANLTISYAGDGTSGIYVGAAQIEAGAYPTSYIPTAGATATRAADVLTGDLTKLPFSTTEGTLLVSDPKLR